MAQILHLHTNRTESDILDDLFHLGVEDINDTKRKQLINEYVALVQRGRGFYE